MLYISNICTSLSLTLIPNSEDMISSAAADELNNATAGSYKKPPEYTEYC